MPYQKVITVYTKQERANLHRLGYWVDKQGNQLSVYEMGRDRLAKLVRTLGSWAIKEHDPLSYIRRQPIYPHVRTQISRLGLRTEYTNLFVYDLIPNAIVVPAIVPSASEDYWQYYMTEPSPEELEQMNLSAEELELQFS